MGERLLQRMIGSGESVMPCPEEETVGRQNTQDVFGLDSE